MEIDAYDDGLALVLELRKPATAATLETARGLLDEWHSAYEPSDPPRYRNTGIEGDIGASSVVLWADRIRDVDGNAGATARLSRIGERAASQLELASWRITSADEASDRDLEQRLGTPAIRLRPGGRVEDAVIDVARRAPASGRPRTSAEQVIDRIARRATERERGAPHGARRTFAVLLVAFAARWLPTPFDGVVTGTALAGGVAVLTWQTRDRTPSWVLALAAATVLASVACVAASFAAPELVRISRLVALVLALAWSVAWSRRSR